MTMTIHTRFDIDGTTVLGLAGEMERSGADRLHAAVQELILLHRPVEIRVDLGRITFVSAGAVAAIDACRATAATTGTRLSLHNCAHVRRQMEAAGIHHFLD
jgi:anti-anti-sigma regulatory factor